MLYEPLHEYNFKRYIAGSKRQNHNLTCTRDTIATVREQHTDSHVLLSASSSSTQTEPIVGFPPFFFLYLRQPCKTVTALETVVGGNGR